MAILVAVLAPQFMKYVEKSRNSADVNNAREIGNAITAYYADTQKTTDEVKDCIVNVTSSGLNVKDKGASQALIDAGLCTGTASDNFTDTKIKPKSTSNFTAYQVKFTISGDTITVSYSATGTHADKFTSAFMTTHTYEAPSP